MSYEILEKLKKEIAGFKDEVEFQDVGIVTETGDGIAKISGLANALSQELLYIETAHSEVPALAANLEDNFIGAILLGEAVWVKVGDRVKKSGKVLSIKVGNELLGRVVDSLGRPADGKGVIFRNPESAQDYFLERAAPSVIERESVSTPLHTGIKAIDAMIPIGRGQRELILGDRQVGKSAIAIDTILNQKSDKIGGGDGSRHPVICIYVAVGQKNSKVAQVLKLLEEAGAMKYTVIVSAPASSPAALQYLAPFAGCAIGEYFMDKGEDALVIYDDLSKHAIAYRELSLLLRRPPGREAYPGDIFYLHSRLLERAAKLKKKPASPDGSQGGGGGSLTALPIIETQLGDVSAYIPTNVISITDGQIYLEPKLFYQGVRPAVNVGLSVSRVGSKAQTKAMKKVAGKLRLELAQFRELEAFVKFASDLDENTKQKIQRGMRLAEILKQEDRAPIEFYKAVPIIYAAISGFLDGIKVSDVKRYEHELLEYLEKLHKTLLSEIEKSGDMSEKTETSLKSAVQDFTNNIFNK